MQRIAAQMIAGMITAPLQSMLPVPVVIACCNSGSRSPRRLAAMMVPIMLT
jgi:Cu/Ag efflux pump CusA